MSHALNAPESAFHASRVRASATQELGPRIEDEGLHGRTDGSYHARDAPCAALYPHQAPSASPACTQNRVRQPSTRRL